jgi:hypothetical protein
LLRQSLVEILKRRPLVMVLASWAESNGQPHAYVAGVVFLPMGFWGWDACGFGLPAFPPMEPGGHVRLATSWAQFLKMTTSEMEALILALAQTSPAETPLRRLAFIHNSSLVVYPAIPKTLRIVATTDPKTTVKPTRSGMLLL